MNESGVGIMVWTVPAAARVTSSSHHSAILSVVYFASRPALILGE